MLLCYRDVFVFSEITVVLCKEDFDEGAATVKALFGDRKSVV